MRLFFTSPSRAQGFLSDQNVECFDRKTDDEIRYGLSQIHDQEWKNIVITIDVKDRLINLMRRVGTIFELGDSAIFYQEDDLPTIKQYDKVIIINDDWTITVAEYKLAEAA